MAASTAPRKNQQITANAVPNTDCAGMKLYGLGAE